MITDKTCLYPQNDLVLFKELEEDDQLIIERKEGQKYQLKDYYCKHKDCNCASIKFSVFLNDMEVGEIYYNYQQAKILEPSNYSFLITEEDTKDFNKYLSIRHESLKLSLEVSDLEEEERQFKEENEALKKEIQELEREVQQLKLKAGAKIGRNEQCPCGSGLKYKKCCLRK